MATTAQPLSTVEPGRCAVVVALEAAGSGAARRLADLGFLPGTEVMVVRRAPFGDPTVYELRGYQMCLRAREAALVRVSAIVPATTADEVVP